MGYNSSRIPSVVVVVSSKTRNVPWRVHTRHTEQTKLTLFLLAYLLQQNAPSGYFRVRIGNTYGYHSRAVLPDLPVTNNHELSQSGNARGKKSPYYYQLQGKREREIKKRNKQTISGSSVLIVEGLHDLIMIRWLWWYHRGSWTMGHHRKDPNYCLERFQLLGSPDGNCEREREPEVRTECLVWYLFLSLSGKWVNESRVTLQYGILTT
jgi:hypothetical protein